MQEKLVKLNVQRFCTTGTETTTDMSYGMQPLLGWMLHGIYIILMNQPAEDRGETLMSQRNVADLIEISRKPLIATIQNTVK